MGGVKSLLIDNDIEFIKNYLRKRKIVLVQVLNAV